MSYIVRDDVRGDVPSTPGGGPWRAIVGHWTAGLPGLAGWQRTVTQVLIPSGKPDGRNVSYHEGWCWDAGTFTVSRIVPDTRIAHSMNPRQPPDGYWKPDAVCRSLLGDKWYDPNRYTYAVAFAGGPTHLAEAMADPAFVGYATRRLRELSAALSLPRHPIFEHWRGQSNKVDWGKSFTAAMYAVLDLPDTSTGDAMPSIVEYVPGHIATIRERANIRPVPGTSKPAIRSVPAGTTEARPVVGWVKGEVNASDPARSDLWLCWWNGQWEYTAKSNVSAIAPPVTDCTAEVQEAVTRTKAGATAVIVWGD